MIIEYNIWLHKTVFVNVRSTRKELDLLYFTAFRLLGQIYEIGRSTDLGVKLAI